MVPLHHRGFFRQFVRLAGPYWSSERKWVARGLALALVVLTVLQIVISIRINLWSADLFDALEQRSMERFLIQIGVIAVILVSNMAITAVHLWVKRFIQLDWRRWLTGRLLDHWMDGGRHYQVTHMPGEHDNPDGRIAEDIRIATEDTIDLAHSLLYSLLLLISFTQILWMLSGALVVPISATGMEVPGHLVWVALVYSTIATSLALWVGRPLIRATDRRQTTEANFRFGLVRARENSEAIALQHGETDERRRFRDLFHGIVDAWRRQTTALTNIMLFTSGYSVLSTAFPVLVAAPRYIAGTITLGTLMQSAQAFQQMVGALSWPVDNLAKVAEWRASVERVLGLSKALQDLDEDVGHIDPHTIVVEETDQPDLVFHDLSIAHPDGEVIVSGIDATVRPGERVLVSGDPAAAAKIFKVVAGLWPWGRGRVERPRGGTIFFMPQRPYMPISRLRSAVSYPAGPGAFDNATLGQAMRRVGLEHLLPRLDEVGAWEQILSADEQQRLGFARLLLNRPNWILLQEATESLDPESEVEMMQLVCEEFPSAGIMTVTYHPALEAFHQRQMVLERSTNGLVLIKETRLRRDTDRRGRMEVPWSRRILGTLRKDRRRSDRLR
jgi:putative ATP-binding cassette transporter